MAGKTGYCFLDVRPRFTHRSLIALGAASLLAGCAVGPEYQEPVLSLPARWHNAGQATPAKQATPARQTASKPGALSEWWRHLGDPLLTALIGEAVEGNLDVATAKARIREARATRRQAIGALFPSLTGSASATRSRTASGGEASGPVNTLQAGFDASWELDIFGANRRGVEAATAGLGAAENDLDSTLLTLVGDVAANYAEARGYQARVALAQRTAASQRQTAALTRTKFDAGTASALDVAQAAASASSTEADIPTNQAAYMQAVHRLGVLLGAEPGALARRLAAATAIPAPRRALPVGVPADVLFARPDVRSAERQLAQYTARIGQAEAARYPSVSLVGDISTSGTRLGDLAKNSSISWSFGPTLSVPIFNAGQLEAAVEVAEAQRDQYFIAYRAAVLTALEDVENAIVALAQERIRARRLAEAVRHYREAARLSLALYRSGTSSFLDVLDAERSLYSAEDALLQSQVATATDYIALAKALGAGWDRPVDPSRPEVVDTGTGPHFALRP